MVQVVLWGSLRAATGGEASVEVEASTVKQMLTALEENYPGLKPALEQGVSVAIDGQIYNDAWFHPIGPENEIFILPRLEGG